MDMAEKKKIRFSRKRERIWEWIRSREDHPRAEDIYQALRQEFPDLSLGTVYKNLHFLEDQGRISRVRGPLGTERFDWRTGDHNHFICRECGMIRDLDLPEDPAAGLSSETADGGHIEAVTLTAVGLCGECRKKLAEKALTADPAEAGGQN